MSKAGASIDGVLTYTIIALILMNSIFAGDGEFMWGMMNTL